MNYFKKIRKDIFPEIKDFSKPQYDLKYTHPKNLSFFDWFWFTSTAFNMIRVMIPWINFINFICLSLLMYWKNHNALANIFLIVGLLFSIPSYKVIKDYHLYSRLSFYEYFIMDKIGGKNANTEKKDK